MIPRINKQSCFLAVALMLFAGAVTASTTGTGIWRQNGTNNPQYSPWNGSAFGAISAAGNFGVTSWLEVAEAPTRTELILMGIEESSEQVRVQVWNGSTWGSIQTLSDLSTFAYKSFAVAYEQQSGRGVIVYHNGQTGSTPLSYQIWDGNSWSAPDTITTPRTGVVLHMYLAANPSSNEMVLVAGNAAGDSYALVWDGSTWGNPQVLELFGGETDFNVAFEQQSGRAVVVYADAALDGAYRIWTGSAWTAPGVIPAPAGETLAPRWFVTASDPNSNNVAVGVLTWGDGSNSHLWLDSWNGTSWETAQTATTTQNDVMAYPSLGVAFERWSGRALATYMPNTTTDTYDYRLWTPGAGWSAAQVGQDINANAHAVQLTPDPFGNAIMLSSIDSDSDVNFALWNGTSWEPRVEMSADAGTALYRPVVFAFDQATSFTIAGTVFEDVNYGGGQGRDRVTAAADAPAYAVGRDGAAVELYDSAGIYLGSITTSGGGAYSFYKLLPGTYTVRVVNASVTSARSGSNGSELAIQTYRADGSSEGAGIGATRIGGEQPFSVDAPANNGAQTLADLQAPPGQHTQSLVTLVVSAADYAGIDFGFNFDTIVNTRDAGQGSLRQFILNANLLGDNAGLDQNGLASGVETSIFMIPGTGDPLGRPADPNFDLGGFGAWRIQPSSAYPALTDTVAIDGYTQAGAQQNTVVFPGASDGVLTVEVNGDLSAGANAFNLTAPGSSLRGLVINGGFNNAVTVGGANCRVVGNHIGTNVPGTGASPTAPNRGILLTASQSTTIGGSGAADRNLISGNAIAGIEATAGATGGVIRGNTIGPGWSGGPGLGNRDGILLSNASATVIGGPGAGEGNVIAYNDSSGVSALAGLGNVISANSIHSNGRIGIDLGDDDVTLNDPGDSDGGLQNYPVIASANLSGGNLSISGSLNSAPGSPFTIEFFLDAAADPSGYGEGTNYLGSIAVNTDTFGDTVFSVTYPSSAVPGDVVTATATGPVDGTSEFSQAVPVTLISSVVLVDSAGTSYPTEVSVLDAAVSINIAVNNLTSTGVMLSTTSTISFSDGSNTYVANLANPTYVPENAMGFTMAFQSAPLPAGIAAPGTYDFTLVLSGTDDDSAIYSDTIVTSGRNSILVRDIRIGTTAIPLQTTAVGPGDIGRAALALDIVNGYATARALDTLFVSNASSGPGSAAQLDAEIASLYLYDDVDSSRTLTPVDTVVAQGSLSGARAGFVVAGAWSVPPMSRRALIVAVDVDSTLARDGDALDLSVPFPADLVFEAGTVVEPDFSPLYPLNSFGTLIVDGMMSHQVYVAASAVDTIYAGDVNTLVATVRIAQNGYQADVLNELAVRNYAVDFSPGNLSALKLFRDTGNGVFDSATDVLLGTLVYSGDRFSLSGLSEPVGPGQTFFVAADVSPTSPNGNHFQPGIPAGGIEVQSANDGPIDADVVAPKAYFIRNIELLNVTNVAFTSEPVHPGDIDVPLLAVSIHNSTLQTVVLDTLRLSNASTGPGLQAELDGNFSSVRLYGDDGNAVIDATDTLLVDGLTFSGGSLIIPNLGCTFDIGEVKTLIVAVDIDSTCSADGTSVRAAIASVNDIVFDVSSVVNGTFPMTTLSPQTIDGMKLFQIGHFARPDSAVLTSSSNVLLLDFALPANGHSVDTLQAIKIFNMGTATTEHLQRIALYADGGDAVFDYGLGDDAYLGDFLEDFTIPGGRAFKIQGLATPLTMTCGAGTRLYVAGDITSNYSVGGSIRMSVPIMGIVVSSGNDGPIDAAVVEPAAQIIPKPNQLTLFPYPIDYRTVHPGSSNNPNLAIGIYNGYSSVAALTEITVFQIGTATSAEIDSVFLYADSDSNGLFNPALDSRIGALEATGASYHFDGLSMPLRSGKVSGLFACYSLPLAVTDSVSIDVQLFDEQSFVVSPANLDIQGDFPINSAGQDIVNGMVAAQIGILTTPAFIAAAGDANTPALRLAIPANGLWDDVLRGMTIRNMGTAVAGTDITGFYLWKEGGGEPTKFDPINDIPIGPLDWNGSRWKNNVPFNETVPVGGLLVYVTFGTTALPTDGATVMARVALNGIEMASGNDGPIDLPITNPLAQQLSTDPLITVLTTDAEVYSTSQPIEVLMFVRNEGADSLYGIVPSMIATNGTGTVLPVAGPVPASVDLPPKTDTFFLWSFDAQAAGSMEFCGWAYAADSLAYSAVGCTPTVQIQTRAANIPVTLTNAAPASVNRGQSDVAMFAFDVDHQGAGNQFASIIFDGVRMTVEDGSGAPVPPNQVFDGANVTIGSSATLKFSTVDSTANPLHLFLQQPVEIQPGQKLDVGASFDIAPAASPASFRISLQGIGDVHLFDPNDGNPTSATSLNSFPWQTTLVTVNNRAESLLVDSGNGATITANTGQRGLAIFTIDLTNPAPPASAAELLTDLTFAFADTAGVDIAPSDVIQKLSIASGGQLLFEITQIPGSGTTLPVNLTTPLIVSAGATTPVTVAVDLNDFPLTSGFSMRLADSSSLVARDINDGHFVTVAAAAPSTFPLASDRVIFQSAASGLLAQHIDRLPATLLPGMVDVPVMDLSLQHEDTGGASSLRVDSLAIEFLDANGNPLYPGDHFSSLLVVGSQDTLFSLTSPSSAANVVECPFVIPIVLTPGGNDMLTIYVSTKSLYTPAIVEIRVERSGIAVYDVNDGSRGYTINGTFPFVSGPSTLQIQSTQAFVDMESRIPANVATQEINTAAFDFLLKNLTAVGITPVHLKTLHVSMENGDGAVMDPSSVLSGARIVCGDSTVITGNVGSSDIVFNMPDGIVQAGSAASDTVSLWVDVATTLDGNFRFAVLDTSDVEVRDMVSGTPVAVSPIAGALFPLRTNYAHVLGASAQGAFTNYPNPFAAGRQDTRVTYYLEQPATVTLKLYTVWGAPVTTLLDAKTLAAGLYQNTVWDGRNEDGDTVTNGVYYMVLEISTADGKRNVYKRKVGVIR